ncbi:MAG: hypothetical protein KF865_08855 [Bdellovibrionaceae bacterium]|nr:hypothetical protein [Pseudobdellovibrionaceae bacterium]
MPNAFVFRSLSLFLLTAGLGLGHGARAMTIEQCEQAGGVVQDGQCFEVDHPASASRQPSQNQCDSSYKRQCDSNVTAAFRSCDKNSVQAKINSALLKEGKAVEKALQEAQKEGETSIKKACEQMKKFNEKVQKTFADIQKTCTQARSVCMKSCDLQLPEECGDFSTAMFSSAQKCESYDNELKVFIQNRKVALMRAEDAKQCGLSMSASSEENGDGAKAEDTSAKTASASTSDSGTDNAEKKKESSFFNSENMGALAGIATGLMSAFGSNQGLQDYTQQTMMPAELDAGSCLRPENVNTCVCNMRFCTGQNTAPTTFGQMLPGGGAELSGASAAGDQLDLSGSGLSFPSGFTGGDNTAATGGGGYAGGGGGFGGGGGGGSFTPDAPNRGGGSRLSADILAGTQGSGNALRLGGGGGTLNPRGPAGGGDDSSDGDAISKLDSAFSDKPSMAQFMPPGAGSLAPGAAARAVGGMNAAGDRSFCPASDGCVPSGSNIFREVAKRYQNLSLTLYP